MGNSNAMPADVVSLKVKKGDRGGGLEAIATREKFHIPSLDGIRAVSFLLVFVSHAGFGYIVPGGFGVNVFFLLSGFLITTLLRIEYDKHGDIRLGGFYLRRAFRILPPMYIALLFGIALTLLNRGGPGVPLKGTLAQVFQVSNYYQIFGDPTRQIPGSDVLWSLAVEEHFYLLFPVVYLWMRRRLPARRQAFALLGFCGAALAWRCLLRYQIHSEIQRIYLATDTRFDSILFGCVFAIIANPVLGDRASRWIIRRMRYILPFACALLLFTFQERDESFRETFRYTLQAIALIPIFISAIHYRESYVVRFLNLPVMRFLGALSYSLYLCHRIILLHLDLLPLNLVRFNLVHLNEASRINLYLRDAMAHAACLLFAVTVHYWVEKPLTQFRKAPSGT